MVTESAPVPRKPAKIKRPMILTFAQNHRMTAAAVRGGISTLLGTRATENNKTEHLEMVYWKSPKNVMIIEMEIFRDGMFRLYINEEMCSHIIPVIMSWQK